MSATSFGSVSRVRVRYAETDQMGVVYYANYLVWFEVGRTDFLREMGWSYRELEQAGYVLPVIAVSCAYHRPARYDEELEIRTRGTLLSPVRLVFDYEIVRAAGAERIVTGRTEHASVSPEGRPVRLPQHIRDLFACTHS
jgi:acyl-CoA thioester hydrolase